MKNNKSNQYEVRRINIFKVLGIAFAIIFAVLAGEFLYRMAVTLWDVIRTTAKIHFEEVFTFEKVFILASSVLLLAIFVVIINRIAVVESRKYQKQEAAKLHKKKQQNYQKTNEQQNAQTYCRPRPFDQFAEIDEIDVSQTEQQGAANYPVRKEETYVLPASFTRYAQ